MSSFLSSGAQYLANVMLPLLPPPPIAPPGDARRPHYTKAGPGRVPRIGGGKHHELRAGRMIRKGYR